MLCLSNTSSRLVLDSDLVYSKSPERREYLVPCNSDIPSQSTRLITGVTSFTTCTNPIINLFNPPKNLHRHCFWFPFKGHLHVPGELANNDYAKSLGGKRRVLWDCASSELRMECSNVEAVTGKRGGVRGRTAISNILIVSSGFY